MLFFKKKILTLIYFKILFKLKNLIKINKKF